MNRVETSRRSILKAGVAALAYLGLPWPAEADPPPGIDYIDENGRLCWMDDYPTRMVEVGESDFERLAIQRSSRYTPDLFGEYIDTRDHVGFTAEDLKERLVRRFTYRAKFERADRAEYAFSIRDGKVFLNGRLCR
jgi:hypothetical protein